MTGSTPDPRPQAVAALLGELYGSAHCIDAGRRFIAAIDAADEASGVRRVTAQELAGQLEQARREAVIAERQRMARAAAKLPEPGPNSGPYERGYYAALDFARQPDWPTRLINSSTADSSGGGVS